MKRLFFCLILTILSLGICTSQSESGFSIGKKYTLNSKILKGEVTYQVHLPYNYEKSSEKYPVIYLLNGQLESTFANAVATVGKLSNERIPDMIIVGMSSTGLAGGFLTCPDDSGRVDKAEAFCNFLEKELLLKINDIYRTNDFRILMGQSNSGLLAIYNLFRYPDMFNVHIISSPMFGWCLEFYKKELGNFLNKNKSMNKRLFISYGDLDYSMVLNSINAFESILKQDAKENMQWKIEKLENTGHVPLMTLNNALLHFFAECTMTSEKMKLGTEQIKTHFNRLSNKYGFAVYPKHYTLLKIAIDLKKNKKYNNAIEMLDYNISLYPYSARSYYEKGIVYLNKKDPELAKKCFNKSLEIEPGYARTKRLLKRLKKR